MISPTQCQTPTSVRKASPGKSSSRSEKNRKPGEKIRPSRKRKPEHAIVEEDGPCGKSHKRGAFRDYRKFGSKLRQSGKVHRKIRERLGREEERRSEAVQREGRHEGEFELHGSRDNPELPLFGPEAVVLGAPRSSEVERPEDRPTLAAPAAFQTPSGDPAASAEEYLFCSGLSSLTGGCGLRFSLP